MTQPLVTINIVVHNGGKYIRWCLDSVLKQTYPHEQIEINILDNNSDDNTWEIIDAESEVWKMQIPKLSFFTQEKNLGMWPGQEWLLEHSHGKYIVALSVDVLLEHNFIKNVVKAMEEDEKIGALQGKIMKYELGSMNYGSIKKTDVIDTVGFEIYKSRRIVNIGHGEKDIGQYEKKVEIFGVEGAVPIFRKEALDNIKIDGHIIDPDFFWYGDDLDLAWRINMFGWKQVYTPNVIAWHDRKTTKELAGGKWKSFIKIRKTVPKFKRRLDYRNWLFTIIKNDFTSNIIKDFGPILKRQVMLWAYFLVFEPWMVLEIPTIVKMVPKMVKRRKGVMKKTRIEAKKIRKWFK
ncbi:MAG: glycosyltransferase [bacterium]|nr:glycosyltransferase [bacterium]